MSAASVESRQGGAKGRGIVGRIVKTLLLTLVPLIAAALIIGVSLQVIGIPVWQTTWGYLKGQNTLPGPSSATQTEISQLQASNDSLTKQVKSLTAQLKTAQSQAKTTQSQLSQAQAQLKAKHDAVTAAKQEAQIVAQMDPSAAAGVIAKLPSSEAGLVIASLSPGASSKILAVMDPAAAAKLLELAGQSDTNAVNSTG